MVKWKEVLRVDDAWALLKRTVFLFFLAFSVTFGGSLTKKVISWQGSTESEVIAEEPSMPPMKSTRAPASISQKMFARPSYPTLDSSPYAEAPRNYADANFLSDFSPAQAPEESTPSFVTSFARNEWESSNQNPTRPSQAASAAASSAGGFSGASAGSSTATESETASGSLTTETEISAEVTAQFQGWLGVNSVGGKSPAAQASDLTTETASVTLSWEPFSLSSGSVSSYKIYRAAAAAGPFTLVGSGSSATSVTDSTVSANQTYYYKISAVVTGLEITPATVADSVIKVIVPPVNLALLHRWSANKQMCGLLGKTVDRDNDYRCAFNGLGNVLVSGANYFDFEHTLFVDRYEQGCNYSYDAGANKCGSADGCIGIIATPNAVVTGDKDDIYYSRRNGRCFINTSAVSGTTWVEATSTTTALRNTMGSAEPGLPPFVNVDQIESQEIFQGKTLAGYAGTKRLIRRKEAFLAGTWPSTMADADIDSLENGTSHAADGQCNANSANGVTTFSNLPLPVDKETIPACSNSDCVSTAASLKTLRTGSSGTRNCVSRYGTQDMAGNVWEWASDQVDCRANGNTTCFGIAAASNTSDNTNNDFSGLLFDGFEAPVTTGLFNTWAKIRYPMAIPVADSSLTTDGIVPISTAASHDDRFAVVLANIRGNFSGGAYNSAGFSGPYTTTLNNAITYTANNLGLRCVFVAE